MWPARDDDRAVLVCDDAADRPGAALSAACGSLEPGPEFLVACARACAGGAPFQVAAPSARCVPRAVLAAATVVYVRDDEDDGGSALMELACLRSRFRDGAGRLRVARGRGWLALRAPHGGAFGALVEKSPAPNGYNVRNGPSSGAAARGPMPAEQANEAAPAAAAEEVKAPPSGKVLVVFDLEATKKYAKYARIMQIAARAYDLGAVKRMQPDKEADALLGTFDTYVNPRVALTDEVIQLTKITPDMVKDAPLFPEAMKMFDAWLDRFKAYDVSLIGHNTIGGQLRKSDRVPYGGYDFPLLYAEMARNRYEPSPREWFRTRAGTYMDTYTWVLNTDLYCRDNLPYTDSGKSKSHKQTYLYKDLFGVPLEGAHNAMNDVAGLARILMHDRFRVMWTDPKVTEWSRPAATYVDELVAAQVKAEGGNARAIHARQQRFTPSIQQLMQMGGDTEKRKQFVREVNAKAMHEADGGGGGARSLMELMQERNEKNKRRAPETSGHAATATVAPPAKRQRTAKSFFAR